MPQKSLGRKRSRVARAATLVTETTVSRQGRSLLRYDDFGTFFACNLEMIAKDADLGVLQFRILLLAVASMDRLGTIPYRQVDLGKQLNVSRQSINKAMRILVEKGLILQEGQRFSVNSRIASKERLENIPRRRRAEAPLLRKLLDQNNADTKRQNLS